MFRPLMMALLLGAAILSGAHAAAPAKDATVKPGFDCAAARSKVKLLICGNADLAALDVREARMLRRARAKAAQPDAVNADEDTWLSERDACASAGCVSRAYARRLRDLHAWTD